MYVSARSDYAIRAMLAVAAGQRVSSRRVGPPGGTEPRAGDSASGATSGVISDGGARADSGGGEPIKAATLATAQEIPLSFLQGILLDLRRAGLLHSHRGVEGGYSLARPAAEISVGDVLRAVSGSLTTVRGLPTSAASYHGVATGLGKVWLAVHSAIEDVVDQTSLADLLAPDLRAGERGGGH
jgi:Rrf2 family protein